MDGSIFLDHLPVAHWDMQEVKERWQDSVWVEKELLTYKKVTFQRGKQSQIPEGESRYVRVGLGKPKPTWT